MPVCTSSSGASSGCRNHVSASASRRSSARCSNGSRPRFPGFFRPNGSAEVGTNDYPGHLWQWDGPPLRWEEPCVMGAANEHVWMEIV